jgi:hypothetical protein
LGPLGVLAGAGLGYLTEQRLRDYATWCLEIRGGGFQASRSPQVM